MGLFKAISSGLGFNFKATESLTTGKLDTLWGSLFGGLVQSKAGPAITWESALRVTTALACVRRIAEGISTIPCTLYQKTGNNGVKEAIDHPLYQLLNGMPNEWMDSLIFRESMTAHAALTGDALCYISRVNGRIDELIPIPPGRYTIQYNENFTLTYYLHGIHDQVFRQVDKSQLWHLRGLSWNGLQGLNLKGLIREALGLALATEQTHSMMHANGARPSGLITVKSETGEQELLRLSAWVRANYGGLDNTSRIMILGDDAKFTPFDLKGVDSQHLETRKFQIEEVCRAFGVMPVLVGHPAEMAARAAISEILMIHLVHCIRPWHRRFEYSMNAQLLTQKERDAGFYFRFNDAEFLRTAVQNRAQYNQIALGGGGNPAWVTVNEVRRWEDLPPDSNPESDKLFAPVNVAPPGEKPQTKPGEPSKDNTGGDNVS